MSSLGYDFTLNSRYVAVLLQAGEESENLERFFTRLATMPFTRGDYQVADAQGRTVDVVLHRSWIVAFWADHPVKLVHIIDLERVD